MNEKIEPKECAAFDMNYLTIWHSRCSVKTVRWLFKKMIVTGNLNSDNASMPD